MWKTPDLGGTASPADWTNLNATLAITTFYGGSATDAAHLIGGAQDDGTLSMVPSGPAAPAWNLQLDGDGTLAQIVPGSSVYYASEPGLALVQGDYTTPGVFRLAAPCDNAPTTAACGDPVSFVAPFAIDPSSTSGATTIYAGTNRVYRSTTGGIPAGAGWTAISPDLTTGGSIFNADTLSTIAVGPNGLVITGSWGGAVWESTNANSANPTWTNISANLPPFDVNGYFSRPWISSVSIVSASQFYVGLGNGQGVYQAPGTYPYQQFWVPLGSPGFSSTGWLLTPATPPRCTRAPTPGPSPACTAARPSRSPARGRPSEQGCPNAPVDALNFAGATHQLVAWTHGRGAWIMANPNPVSLSFNTNHLDFGTVMPGGQVNPQTVDVSMTANRPVAFQGVTIAGPNASDFSIATNSCSGPVVGCGVTVGFAPSAPGLRSATLKFVDDALSSPQTVALSAVVTTASAIFSPSQVNLGGAALGTTSATVTATITDTGTGPLVVGALSISESDGGHIAIVGGTDNCTGQTLPAGQGCTVGLAMTPVSAGAINASLDVPDNAGAGLQQLGVVGTANGPVLADLGASHDLGSMNIGVGRPAVHGQRLQLRQPEPGGDRRHRGGSQSVRLRHHCRYMRVWAGAGERVMLDHGRLHTRRAWASRRDADLRRQRSDEREHDSAHRAGRQRKLHASECHQFRARHNRELDPAVHHPDERRTGSAAAADGDHHGAQRV